MCKSTFAGVTVAITHEFCAHLASLNVYSKAFDHYEFCWRTKLLSSVMDERWKSRAAELCVLRNTVVCYRVFVSWSRPRSQGSRTCIGVVVSPPEEFVWVRFHRVSGLANHRYDSSSAHLSSSSYVHSICSGRSGTTVMIAPLSDSTNNVNSDDRVS